MFLAEKQQAYDEYEVRFKVHSTRNTFNIIFKSIKNILDKSEWIKKEKEEEYSFI